MIDAGFLKDKRYWLQLGIVAVPPIAISASVFISDLVAEHSFLDFFPDFFEHVINSSMGISGSLFIGMLGLASRSEVTAMFIFACLQFLLLPYALYLLSKKSKLWLIIITAFNVLRSCWGILCYFMMAAAWSGI